MAIYQDINVSLANNLKNDFSVINELFNVVKATLSNNLMISSREMPFDNRLRPNVDDTFHSIDPDIFIARLQDSLESAINIDDRIDNLDSIKITSDTDNAISIILRLKLKNIKDIQSFNVTITKT